MNGLAGELILIYLQRSELAKPIDDFVDEM
ncbi:hypothetical protein D806_040040 [Mycolicibacterium smegmatis MKD8]|uniref:Uncharacterized protein n=1 Tax=Mycolicibacterium smegmatis (strain MKD8) TaxID=1214915 RepID=A0A2U9PT42_MYCSE|nr:hypothetical protein D806_040040 [Mycolicibacterium smegmatis MKD8]